MNLHATGDAVLSPKKPRLLKHGPANGNWLGRPPEILRQMAYAHKLLLPTACVIFLRDVFAAGGGQDWQHSFKQACRRAITKLNKWPRGKQPK